MPYKQDKTYRHDCTGGADSVALADTLTLDLTSLNGPIGVSFVFRNDGTADGYLGIPTDTHVSAITIAAGESFTTGDYFSSSMPTLYGLDQADIYVTPVVRYRG